MLLCSIQRPKNGQKRFDALCGVPLKYLRKVSCHPSQPGIPERNSGQRYVAAAPGLSLSAIVKTEVIRSIFSPLSLVFIYHKMSSREFISNVRYFSRTLEQPHISSCPKIWESNATMKSHAAAPSPPEHYFRTICQEGGFHCSELSPSKALAVA